MHAGCEWDQRDVSGISGIQKWSNDQTRFSHILHVLAYIFSTNGPSLHEFTELTVHFRFKAGKLASTRLNMSFSLWWTWRRHILPCMMHIEKIYAIIVAFVALMPRMRKENRLYVWIFIPMNQLSFPCHSDHFAVWLNRYNACSSEYLQGRWSYAINSTKVKRISPLWLPKYKHWPRATWRGLR